jgi:hypothetical protein
LVRKGHGSFALAKGSLVPQTIALFHPPLAVGDRADLILRPFLLELPAPIKLALSRPNRHASGLGLGFGRLPRLGGPGRQS